MNNSPANLHGIASLVMINACPFIVGRRNRHCCLLRKWDGYAMYKYSVPVTRLKHYLNQPFGRYRYLVRTGIRVSCYTTIAPR